MSCFDNIDEFREEKRYLKKDNTTGVRDMYADYWKNYVNLYGIQTGYYRHGYNLKSQDDFLYGEDATESFYNPLMINMIVEYQTDAILLSKFGIESTADLTAIVVVSDYEKIFGIGAEPKAGDIIELTEAAWETSEMNPPYDQVVEMFNIVSSDLSKYSLITEGTVASTTLAPVKLGVNETVLSYFTPLYEPTSAFDGGTYLEFDDENYATVPQFDQLSQSAIDIKIKMRLHSVDVGNVWAFSNGPHDTGNADGISFKFSSPKLFRIVGAVGGGQTIQMSWRDLTAISTPNENKGADTEWHYHEIHFEPNNNWYKIDGVDIDSDPDSRPVRPNPDDCTINCRDRLGVIQDFAGVDVQTLQIGNRIWRAEGSTSTAIREDNGWHGVVYDADLIKTEYPIVQDLLPVTGSMSSSDAYLRMDIGGETYFSPLYTPSVEVISPSSSALYFQHDIVDLNGEDITEVGNFVFSYQDSQLFMPMYQYSTSGEPVPATVIKSPSDYYDYTTKELLCQYQDGGYVSSIQVDLSAIYGSPYIRYPQLFEVTEVKYQDYSQQGMNFAQGHYIWLLHGKRFDYSYEPNAPMEGPFDQVYDSTFAGIVSATDAPSSDGKVYDQNIDDASEEVWDYEEKGTDTGPYGYY